MHCSFLGIGLINGSAALALRRAGGWTAAAWSESGEGPRAARAAGAVDVAAASIEEALAGADLVVLGAPASTCLDLLHRIAACRGALEPGAVITDVASSKAMIVARAAALGLRFVGGHPMAGREQAGFAAGTADLFIDRPWVIVRGAADDEAVARVAALATAAGARIVEMEADVHDRAVAAISHLPLVAATALVEAVVGGPGAPVSAGWADASRLAAGGWRDMTRLARGDASMGAGIAATNAPALAAVLRAYRTEIDEWLALLEASVAGGPDEAALRERFASARGRLGEPA